MGPPVVEIVEIQGRSAHGFQEPFQCIGNDGKLYYVKGRQTDRASLCHEWICGHLARHLGLPIPPFALVNVSEELMAEAPVAWRALGVGIAFGSQQHPGCTWFTKAQAHQVSSRMQTDVMGFDWWVRNLDRTDGNPNLLWDASQSEIVVIDHNLAFDATFDADAFINLHIFKEQWMVLDLIARDALQRRFCATADAVLEEACDNIPPEWQWMNPECDIASNMDVVAVREQVLRCHHPDFWRFQ